MKAINIATLTVSLIALAMSVWTYQQADARAEQALQRREKVLVEKYKPEVERICKDFGLKERSAEPQTLDELFQPLSSLLTGLSK